MAGDASGVANPMVHDLFRLVPAYAWIFDLCDDWRVRVWDEGVVYLGFGDYCGLDVQLYRQ